ncbi:hypothetical protein IMSAGC011_02103 [Lachnospiraceae bacterium]|nr:hypothetical protein IMSAGC011_02103 [Lachnospiraceae bacterium]
MRNLLSANFARLRRSRLFWFLEAGVFLWGVFAYYMLKINLRNGYAFDNGNTYLFNQMTFIGITTACFSGFFIGTEYSDGTMRNKLSVGHSRIHVYLANLITVFFVAIAQFVVYILASFTAGTLLVGDFVWSKLYRPVETIAISLLSLITSSVIAVLISMVIIEKSKAVLLNVLLSMLLLIVGASALKGVMQPEMVKRMYFPETKQYKYIYTESISEILDDASIVIEEVSNPKYLRGAERKLYECVSAILPTAQALSCGIDAHNFIRFSAFHVLGTLMVGLILTSGGILVFQRIDLK